VVVIAIMFPFVFPIIALSMFVPGVFMLDPAVFSFPVAFIVLAALIPWGEPRRAGVGCPSPVPLMPLPMVADGIPVSLDPDVIMGRLHGPNVFDTRRRRRADLNANRNLSSKSGASEKDHGKQCRR
jgi:hypothetical protein